MNVPCRAATILAMLLLAGCSGNGRSSSGNTTPIVTSTASGASGAAGSALAWRTTYLRSHSYTPVSHFDVALPGGHQLVVVHSICAGSADGHCQAVTAFLDNRHVPVFERHYSTIDSVRPVRMGFEIVARGYRSSDALCCPTGRATDDTYAWDGTTLRKTER